MTIISISDIEGKITRSDLIRLTDEDGAGAIDSGKMTNCISEAEAEFLSYTTQYYPAGFSSPVPDMVKKGVLDIAVYNVWSLKTEAPEGIEKRYSHIVSWLKDVARGIAKIGTDAPAEVDDGGPESIKSADEKTFTMNTMAGF